MSTNLVLNEKPRALARAKAARNSSEADRKPGCESGSSVASPESVLALEQASRMEAINRLAGDFAHDFNNLLAVILGHTEFLLKNKESPEISRSRVVEIRKAAERGAWLTNQLLAYSQNQLPEPARRP